MLSCTPANKTVSPFYPPLFQIKSPAFSDRALSKQISTVYNVNVIIFFVGSPCVALPVKLLAWLPRSNLTWKSLSSPSKRFTSSRYSPFGMADKEGAQMFSCTHPVSLIISRSNKMLPTPGFLLLQYTCRSLGPYKCKSRSVSP